MSQENMSPDEWACAGKSRAERLDFYDRLREKQIADGEREPDCDDEAERQALRAMREDDGGYKLASDLFGLGSAMMRAQADQLKTHD